MMPKRLAASLITAPAASPGWVRDDSKLWLVGAIVTVMLVLLMVPGGFDYRWDLPPLANETGNPATRAIWIGFIAVCSVLVLIRARLTWLLLQQVNPFLLAFFALALASTLWSIDPEFTLRRIVRMFTISLVVLSFVVVAWHPRRFQNLLRPLVTVMITGSLIFGIVAPDLAIHPEQSAELIGAWRGLTPGKNGLGALSSLGAILWVHAWVARETRARNAMYGVVTAFACLVLSRSTTSLMATTLVCALLLMLRTPEALRRYVPHLVTVLATVTVIYSMAVLRVVPGLETLITPIYEITGKDATFTGRSTIWAAVVEHINKRPIFGSGYGGFWTGSLPDTESASVSAAMAGNFYPGSAHNGYLDVLNDLGTVGLLLLGGYLVVYVRQCFKLARFDRPQAVLFLGLFLQQVIGNLSESRWWMVTTADYAVMTLATFALARALLEPELRRRFPAGR